MPSLTHPVEAPLDPAANLIRAYQNLTKGVSLGLSLLDQWYISQYPTVNARIPPFHLRFRVQGSPDLSIYLHAGQASRRAIDAVLARLGKWAWDFPEILDFGCGCGRTLIQMRDLVPTARLSGTDIHEESVQWCQANLDFADVGLNQLAPPLQYPDNRFDLIYALSVFTHLDEAAQFEWLAELNRVLKPGGLLLLTFLGYDPNRPSVPVTEPAQVLLRALTGLTLDPWQDPSPAQLAHLIEHGYVFVPFKVKLLFYEEYGNAFHRRDYIQTRYAEYMDIVEYLPDALLGALDIVLLRKRA